MLPNFDVIIRKNQTISQAQDLVELDITVCRAPRFVLVQFGEFGKCELNAYFPIDLPD